MLELEGASINKMKPRVPNVAVELKELSDNP